MLEERNVRHVFAWMMTRADLHALVHDLRHTFANLLLQAGAPITYGSKQLGHADASITLWWGMRTTCRTLGARTWTCSTCTICNPRATGAVQ